MKSLVSLITNNKYSINIRNLLNAKASLISFLQLQKLQTFIVQLVGSIAHRAFVAL